MQEAIAHAQSDPYQYGRCAVKLWEVKYDLNISSHT